MKFKAAPQSHIVPALKRIASALQSESITPEEVSYRLAMVRMALSQTAQQAVEAMGPIQADSREKVMDGFQKANPALTQDQLEEIADQWEKNKDQLKTAAYDRSLDWVKSHADRVEEYQVEWDSRLIGFSKKKWNGLNGDGQKKYEEELKRKALKPRYRAWEGDVFYDISKDTYEKSKNLFKTAAKRELLDPSKTLEGNAVAYFYVGGDERDGDPESIALRKGDVPLKAVGKYLEKRLGAGAEVSAKGSTQLICKVKGTSYTTPVKVEMRK